MNYSPPIEDPTNNGDIDERERCPSCGKEGCDCVNELELEDIL